jgi:hypothetical protein
MLRMGIIANFDESESARLAAKAVAHDSDGFNGNTVFREKSVDILFSSGVWKVSDKKLLHSELLEIRVQEVG